MELKQVFIKCHDNDYWFHYLHALKSVFDWYNFHPRPNINFENIEKYIRACINNLSLLTNDGKYEEFWAMKRLHIYFNEEAKIQYEEEVEYANGECAYMNIFTYLITPNAQIEDFIFIV